MVGPALEMYKLYGIGDDHPSKDMVLLEKVAATMVGKKDSMGVVTPLSTPSENIEFRNAFLAIVVGHLLCPTSMCTNLSHSVMGVVSLGGVAEEYDWCTWTYNRLMERVEVFSKSFDELGYVGGCGGCVVALMIFYLDRLAGTPVDVEPLPRVKVWGNLEVKQAIREDKRSGYDYGRLKSKKVVYGRGPDGEVTNSVSGLTNKEADRRMEVVDESMTGNGTGTETDLNLIPRADVGMRHENTGGNTKVSLNPNLWASLNPILDRDRSLVHDLAHQVLEFFKPELERMIIYVVSEREWGASGSSRGGVGDGSGWGGGLVGSGWVGHGGGGVVGGGSGVGGVRGMGRVDYGRGGAAWGAQVGRSRGLNAGDDAPLGFEVRAPPGFEVRAPPGYDVARASIGYDAARAPTAFDSRTPIGFDAFARGRNAAFGGGSLSVGASGSAGKNIGAYSAGDSGSFHYNIGAGILAGVSTVVSTGVSTAAAAVSERRFDNVIRNNDDILENQEVLVGVVISQVAASCVNEAK
ncbi:uncharacterized protein [Spinacia oleracea]|uniref:Uncharacterized protein n=1 Tax=Spinacia oleracea TaxID=3562 RepID=A0ABM3RPJ2_SPIOL|nr:uncharacterized protein LOC130471441 [Spinacia oleracea]